MLSYWPHVLQEPRQSHSIESGREFRNGQLDGGEHRGTFSCTRIKESPNWLIDLRVDCLAPTGCLLHGCPLVHWIGFGRLVGGFDPMGVGGAGHCSHQQHAGPVSTFSSARNYSQWSDHWHPIHSIWPICSIDGVLEHRSFAGSRDANQPIGRVHQSGDIGQGPIGCLPSAKLGGGSRRTGFVACRMLARFQRHLRVHERCRQGHSALDSVTSNRKLVFSIQ